MHDLMQLSQIKMKWNHIQDPFLELITQTNSLKTHAHVLHARFLQVISKTSCHYQIADTYAT